MWPFLKKRFHVVLLGNPQYLICCAFSQQSSKLLNLYAYKPITFEHLELEGGTLFNPTRISNHIQHFLTSQKLGNPFITIGLSGPSITERLITTDTAFPSSAQLYGTSTPHLVWAHEYIYPQEHNQFTFYVCGIPQHILFQYQLLALKNHLNIIRLTTESIALLTLYKYLAGNTFRQTQLALDMKLNHNILETLIPHAALDQILEIPSHISVHSRDVPYLLTACGLLLGETYL